MKTTDHDKVAHAYLSAWRRTRDFDVAYAAAEQTYRLLNPAQTDAATVRCIVAIAIGSAIGEVECDGPGPDDAEPTAANDSVRAGGSSTAA